MQDFVKISSLIVIQGDALGLGRFVTLGISIGGFAPGLLGRDAVLLDQLRNGFVVVLQLDDGADQVNGHLRDNLRRFYGSFF